MKYEAGELSDFEDGEIKSFRFKKTSVCVVKHKGEFKAFRNACPHQFVPLADGFLGDDSITCCLHGWKFDLTTGVCEIAPEMPLPIYKVIIEDNKVFVEIEEK